MASTGHDEWLQPIFRRYKYDGGNPEISWRVVLSVSSSVYVFPPNFLSIIDPVSPVTISFAHTLSDCLRTSIPSSMSYYTLRPFRYPASLLCPINVQVSLLLFYFYFWMSAPVLYYYYFLAKLWAIYSKVDTIATARSKFKRIRSWLERLHYAF